MPMPHMPPMQVAAACSGIVHWVLQPPQWLMFTARSKQVEPQQLCPAWQACVAEHPGTQTLFATKQTEPSGQSVSGTPPTQLFVVTSQNRSTPPLMQSALSVQPTLHAFVAGSQNWPFAQTSFVGRQATQP